MYDSAREAANRMNSCKKGPDNRFGRHLPHWDADVLVGSGAMPTKISSFPGIRSPDDSTTEDTEVTERRNKRDL
jgi:hypothetical protein